MSAESLLAAVQAACLPGVWSKGIALSREPLLVEDSRTEDEVVFRVRVPNRPVSPKVTLWLDGDDWYCDCGDRNDPCHHVAAAALRLKAPRPAAEAPAPAVAQAPRLVYRFRVAEDGLHFERVLMHEGQESRLTGTLVAHIGGIQSGRIAAPLPLVTQEDYAVDAALGVEPRTLLSAESGRKLFHILKRFADFPLHHGSEFVLVRVSPDAARPHAVISDENGGFRVRGLPDARVSEVFANGFALGDGIVRPLLPNPLPPEGRFFPAREVGTLLEEWLPALEAQMTIENRSRNLPKPERHAPRIELRLESYGPEKLSVIPALVYGDPAIAQIHGGEARPLVRGRHAVRDRAAEHQLVRKLQSELQLQVDQRLELTGPEAVAFTENLRGWRTTGEATRRFAVETTLSAHFEVREGSFAIQFRTADGQGGGADPARVFQAWQTGDSHVPLLAGGWAPLPADWLARYGEQILALAEGRSLSEPVPIRPYRQPELAELGEALGARLPAGLARMRDLLAEHTRIPDASLPPDLRADLRHYQRTGINWLSFLRDAGLGALLADDMGLGKTLQALAALRGKTLVVAPTSVLQSWREQIARFRPGLRVHVYYGPKRELDPQAELTLTTYGMLRSDRSALQAVAWDTVVLDEAQTIKNPESQIAQAAHALPGAFRVALSGTPVENSLSNLWSQFQFVNPGLLGTRAEFTARFAAPLTQSAPHSPDAEAAARSLRQRIRPFLLRRLKQEVAPELPPRTEIELRCELSAPERDLYDAILASTRAEVLAELAQGKGVFAGLEMLLRLRQACCHPWLVTGAGARAESAPLASAKLTLLLETLSDSIAGGHRALVFSQWTSYLDLLEPELRGASIGFVRLDGSTRDRESVVQAFQSPDGPPVFLISLKAGGVGLTLTAADHVFILDPWWNPAAENQAADRAHRIGQENPVLIHRLVAQDTIEEKILALQKRKLALAETALHGAAQAMSLGRDDLMDLLSD